jgi:hypothetical protein
MSTATWASVLRRTIGNEGLAGLYRGIGVAVVGSCPAACIYFTSYEIFKTRLRASTLGTGYPFLAGKLDRGRCAGQGPTHENFAHMQQLELMH